MPLKLSVGVSRKLGLPGYSSLGASCLAEFDMDASLLRINPEEFHRKGTPGVRHLRRGGR